MSGAPPAAPPRGASVVAPDDAIAQAAWQAGFDGSNLVIATAVALAESSGDCYAVSSAGDYGLWQINYKAHTDLFQKLNNGLDWANPVMNAEMAASVFYAAGSKWSPWVTYNTGAYTPFLIRAQAAAKVVSTDQSNKDLSDVLVKISQAGGGGNPIGTPLIPTGNSGPFLRLLEIFIGVGLLFIGLKQLTAPVSTPVIQTAKSVAKKAAVAAAL